MHRLREALEHNSIHVLQVIAIVGGLLPFLWLDVRVEYDDGWFTIAGYQWAFYGVPRIPAFAGSASGDDEIHFRWPMVSGAAATAMRLFSEFMPFVACARLPMAVASLSAILLLGIRGSRVLGPLAAWGAAAFLALDSVVFLNARTVRPEALLLPMLVWVLLKLFLVLQGQSRPVAFLAPGVLVGAGWFLLHPNSIAVPALILVSAYLFNHDRKTLLRTILWAGIGMAFGFVLYAAIAYSAVGNHAFKGTAFQTVGKEVMSYAQGDQSYLSNAWVLIKKWSVFPYRAIILVCLAVAVYGIRTRFQMRFLLVAAFIYLALCAVFRGSGNMRYMAYISLMMAPVLGVCLAEREKLFGPLGRKVLIGVYAVTLLSGFGNVYETARLREASSVNLRSTLEQNVASDSTIIGSLWIGGVVPERKLILDLYFPKYFEKHQDQEYYVIEDGFYGRQEAISILLEETGLRLRTVKEVSVPRLNYIRISKVVPSPMEGRH